MHPDTKLCAIRCIDDSVYTLRAGIRALLIEVNDRLRHTPNLICSSPENRGFIAILMPLSNEKNSALIEL